MSDEQTIDMLRTALAAIWTACEHDGFTDEQKVIDSQLIADEALYLTAHKAKPKSISDLIGCDSWREFLLQRKIGKYEV